MRAIFVELPPFERVRKAIWLFTVYDKDQADDLTPEQRKVLKQLLSVWEHRQPVKGH